MVRLVLGGLWLGLALGGWCFLLLVLAVLAVVVVVVMVVGECPLRDAWLLAWACSSFLCISRRICILLVVGRLGAIGVVAWWIGGGWGGFCCWGGVVVVVGIVVGG